MSDELVQVNTSMDRETASQLDQMTKASGLDNRSAFVRWLIRQEYARRYSQPNPTITIAEAQAAAEGTTK